MASLLNDLKLDEKFKNIVKLGQEIGKPDFQAESIRKKEGFTPWCIGRKRLAGGKVVRIGTPAEGG